MPDFETFKKSLLPLAKPPTVTVQKRGTITLNAAAYAELGRPAAVELLYDRDTRILGLRAVAATVGHATFVRPANRSGNGPYVISAMAFVKYFKIDTAVARCWPTRLDGDTLCVDLAATGRDVSRARTDAGETGRPETGRPRPRTGRRRSNSSR